MKYYSLLKEDFEAFIHDILMSILTAYSIS